MFVWDKIVDRTGYKVTSSQGSSEDMLLYTHLQKIMYILNAPITLWVIEALFTCFIPKMEAIYANNLFLNPVPLSDKILCNLPILEYILIKEACTASSASLVYSSMHQV